MKRPLWVWGLLLTVVGFLLFRLGILRLYPESVRYAQVGNLGGYWAGLTAGQKLFITGMEIPFLAGIVLLFVGLVKLATGKRSSQ
jgi:uncharacterized membrane protein